MELGSFHHSYLYSKATFWGKKGILHYFVTAFHINTPQGNINFSFLLQERLHDLAGRQYFSFPNPIHFEVK